MSKKPSAANDPSSTPRRDAVTAISLAQAILGLGEEGQNPLLFQPLQRAFFVGFSLRTFALFRWLKPAAR